MAFDAREGNMVQHSDRAAPPARQLLFFRVSSQSKGQSERYLLVFSGLLLFVLLVSVNWALVWNAAQPDIAAHLRFIERGDRLGYPLWHWLVLGAHEFLHLSLQASAIVVNMSLTLGTFLVYVEFLRQQVPSIDRGRAAWLGLALSVCGAIYFPYFSRHMYYGTGSPNIWHNPTSLAIEFCQVICFAAALAYLQRPGRKALWLSGVLLGVTVFAKPTFAITFVPALIIYATLFDERNGWSKFSLPALAFAIVAIPLLYQHGVLYGAGNRRSADIIVAPLAVWSHYTNSVLLSMVSALLFPLALTLRILTINTLSLGGAMIIAWLNLVMGMLPFIVFAEAYHGKIAYDGNFAWGYYLAMPLLFLTCVARWQQVRSELSTAWNRALLAVLLAHVFFGLVYAGKIVFWLDIS